MAIRAEGVRNALLGTSDVGQSSNAIENISSKVRYSCAALVWRIDRSPSCFRRSKRHRRSRKRSEMTAIDNWIIPYVALTWAATQAMGYARELQHRAEQDHVSGNHIEYSNREDSGAHSPPKM